MPRARALPRARGARAGRATARAGHNAGVADTPPRLPVSDDDDRYPVWSRVPTRWSDNDVYGHVNNTVHYLVMDTVINDWLIEHAGLDIDPTAGEGAIGLCVESQCTYSESITYPDAFEVGLRVGRLGSSSVTWEVLLRRASDGGEVARGRFVHVFVDRVTRRPQPIVGARRAAFDSLVGRPGPAGAPTSRAAGAGAVEGTSSAQG